MGFRPAPRPSEQARARMTSKTSIVVEVACNCGPGSLATTIYDEVRAQYMCVGCGFVVTEEDAAARPPRHLVPAAAVSHVAEREPGYDIYGRPRTPTHPIVEDREGVAAGLADCWQSLVDAVSDFVFATFGIDLDSEDSIPTNSAGPA